MMMLRVVNSQGPFLSSENKSASRVGKRLFSIVERWVSAREVVESALRQRRVSWRSVSSCSSLGFHVSKLFSIR